MHACCVACVSSYINTTQTRMPYHLLQSVSPLWYHLSISRQMDKWMDGWMERGRPLMLTVVFLGSDIIIFIFILMFSNFSKNPYYSYDQITKEGFFEIKIWNIKITFLLENTTEVARCRQRAPLYPLAFFSSPELPRGHSPSFPPPLPQPISGEFTPLPHSWSYFNSPSTWLSSSDDSPV